MTNSLATGKRTRFYCTIHCAFCNQPNFDQNHMFISCPIPNKVIQFLSTKMPIYKGFFDWEALLIHHWKKGRLKIEGPKLLLFSLFIIEIFSSFYKKAFNNQYYIDHILIAHNIIKRTNDSIKIAKYLNFNIDFIQNLSHIYINLK